MKFNYKKATVSDLHRLLVDKKVTSLELVQEAIELAKADPHNILEATNYENALKEAALITEVKEDEFFKGIPYFAKDNISTKGIVTCASSKILEGYSPIYDASVITMLKAKGAILIGKTTLDELAMGGTGTTGHKGVTTNPYDKNRIVGGSSCGSASAVASGIVPFALGSDTGDSVRKPAAYAGLVGYKPTWGRISRYGLFSFATSLDTIAYFTRSVEDSAKLLEVLAGPDQNDLSSSEEKVPQYSEYLSRNPKIRIGYFPNLVKDIKDQEIINKYKDLLESLKNSGHELIEYEFPQVLLNAIYPTYMILSCSEATSNNANLDGIKFGPGVEDAKDYEDYIVKVRTKGFSNMIKRRFVIGSFSLLANNQNELFTRAQKARRIIVNEMENFFKKADALLLPAAPTIAPRIDSVSNSWSKEPDYLENHLGLANLAGCPSLTLPLGFSNDLPIAINLTAAPFDDKTIFSLGQEIEDITGLQGLVKEN